MSRNQRMALLAAAALIAVAAFLAVRPGEEDPTTASNSRPTSPSQAPNDAPADHAAESGEATSDAADAAQRTPRPKPPLLVAGQERTLTYQKDDTVRFRVRHPSREEVHVHGYDVSKDIPAGRTVTVSFPAQLEGIFEVELEHSGTPLGSIRVEP